MKIKIFIITLIVLILAAYFGFNYAIEHVIAYSPIRPYRCIADSFLSPDVAGLKWEQFNITVEDTINLKGWFVYSSLDTTKGTIFLMHGISNCKAGMLSTAQLLSNNGFNCVLYDSRANGESGGINCTFGFYEKYDLSAYIDSTINRFPGTEPYGIFGHSMGAAVALQALELDKRISCGVVMSPFADLKQIIRDYFARSFIELNSIPDEALKYSEKIAAFNVDSVKPAVSASHIAQPVLVIHGCKDNDINIKYGKEVYDNLLSKEKEWYPVPNGKHNNLSVAGGEEWKKRIIIFFNKHMGHTFPQMVNQIDFDF